MSPVAIAHPVKGMKTKASAMTLAALTNNMYTEFT